MYLALCIQRLKFNSLWTKYLKGGINSGRQASHNEKDDRLGEPSGVAQVTEADACLSVQTGLEQKHVLTYERFKVDTCPNLRML
jgi:hypothetical protein